MAQTSRQRLLEDVKTTIILLVGVYFVAEGVFGSAELLPNGLIDLLLGATFLLYGGAELRGRTVSGER